MPESAEIIALREHYDSVMRREAYRYQQRIDALVQQLEEERKRNALLEAELVQHLRRQSPAIAATMGESVSSPIELRLNSKMTANIIDARELKEKDGGRKYTAYVINMSNQVGDAWTLYKRYRQFEVLHCLLVRRFADDVPEFPPKHELISKSVKIPKRQAALQDYCNNILNSPTYSTYSPVVEFFKNERVENSPNNTSINSSHSR